MKSLRLLALVVTVALAACGGKDAGNSAAPANAANLAAVPPPAGKQWADVVAESPEHGFVMGNPSAAVKVAEYGSFTCPHCRDFATESAADVQAMVNTGKMSFEFRNYVRDPLDMTMGLLARCGGAEPFFPLMEQLFQNQAAAFEKLQAGGDGPYQAAMALPPEQRFFALAQAAGLIDFVKQRGISEEKAKQCLGDTKTIELLAKGVQDANTQYNITGTPTLLLNGAVVPETATWDLMKAKLKEAGL
ncbi:DsbA family protein [Sphingobium subterraneum]|uniref:Protein-disulfide isomerase n=1 Tax=Sphingobium subterraneum TaxID=627688 RepID=A0A841J7Q4_9SPHN|nr:thioredoxin domain-containing protein [Sphingobium subterraneum]MBB6124211.1 protein-disulfide isomerase [Sphingobium subterraneum]